MFGFIKLYKESSNLTSVTHTSSLRSDILLYKIAQGASGINLVKVKHQRNSSNQPSALNHNGGSGQNLPYTECATVKTPHRSKDH